LNPKAFLRFLLSLEPVGFGVYTIPTTKNAFFFRPGFKQKITFFPSWFITAFSLLFALGARKAPASWLTLSFKPR